MTATIAYKNADYFSDLNKEHRQIMRICKEIALQYEILITNKNRTSDSYVFTFIPGQKESELALQHLKDYIKGTAFRIKRQGRAGRNGTQKRGCYNSVSFVPLSDATRMDVYVYSK